MSWNLSIVILADGSFRARSRREAGSRCSFIDDGSQQRHRQKPPSARRVRSTTGPSSLSCLLGMNEDSLGRRSSNTAPLCSEQVRRYSGSRTLARISNRWSARAPKPSAMITLRSVGLLNVLYTYTPVTLRSRAMGLRLRRRGADALSSRRRMTTHAARTHMRPEGYGGILGLRKAG